MARQKQHLFIHSSSVPSSFLHFGGAPLIIGFILKTVKIGLGDDPVNQRVRNELEFSQREAKPSDLNLCNAVVLSNSSILNET
ncbi:hypothetical protein SAY86_030805 [Trapa natans]|uniref:Uncharacterized protein n=1 Tax=Trapa natans TaxID=22666 RepID=A0AAN7M5R3_TRANT|nr:hypothetical protein SAY86_030805 [Trapa natans]